MALFALGRQTRPTAISEERARRRHVGRLAYEAMIIEANRPRFICCFYPDASSTETDSVRRCLNGSGDAILVYFIDSKSRWYLEYEFQERRPSNLFLSHAVFREFVKDTEKVLNEKTFVFREDGRTLIVDENLADGKSTERRTTCSVEENWESYPAFSDFAGICKENRKPQRSRGGKK